VKSAGERLRIGEIDPRCVSPTNELPKLTPEQAAARTDSGRPGLDRPEIEKLITAEFRLRPET
jgi:hypothetical protein